MYIEFIVMFININIKEVLLHSCAILEHILDEIIKVIQHIDHQRERTVLPLKSPRGLFKFLPLEGGRFLEGGLFRGGGGFLNYSPKRQNFCNFYINVCLFMVFNDEIFPFLLIKNANFHWS